MRNGGLTILPSRFSNDVWPERHIFVLKEAHFSTDERFRRGERMLGRQTVRHSGDFLVLREAVLIRLPAFEVRPVHVPCISNDKPLGPPSPRGFALPDSTSKRKLDTSAAWSRRATRAGRFRPSVPPVRSSMTGATFHAATLMSPSRSQAL